MVEFNGSKSPTTIPKFHLTKQIIKADRQTPISRIQVASAKVARNEACRLMWLTSKGVAA